MQPISSARHQFSPENVRTPCGSLCGLQREPGQAEGAQKPEPFEQEADVVADGDEDGVGGVAMEAAQAVAGRGVLVLEVADDRLDGDGRRSWRLMAAETRRFWSWMKALKR